MKFSYDVILNNNYKYVCHDHGFSIFHNNKPLDLRPKRLYKFYQPSLISIAALYRSEFWLANPAEFNDPFDCSTNLFLHNRDLYKTMDPYARKNDIANIGVTCFTETVYDPLLWAHYTNNYRGFAIEFDSQLKLVPIYKRKL